VWFEEDRGRVVETLEEHRKGSVSHGRSVTGARLGEHLLCRTVRSALPASAVRGPWSAVRSTRCGVREVEESCTLQLVLQHPAYPAAGVLQYSSEAQLALLHCRSDCTTTCTTSSRGEALNFLLDFILAPSSALTVACICTIWADAARQLASRDSRVARARRGESELSARPKPKLLRTDLWSP
jgi:hypothetical protein